MNEESDDTQEVVSAGVLCYAYTETTHDIFFLLGKEKSDPNWSQSNKWCDFGGSLQPQETEEQGAAREFVEESMGVVSLAMEDYGVIMDSTPPSFFTQIDKVTRVLEEKKYTFRLSVGVKKPNAVPQSPSTPTLQPDLPLEPPPTTNKQNRTRVCYVKRIPWQPDLPEKFDQLRQVLVYLHDLALENQSLARDYYLTLASGLQQHPSILVTRDPDKKITRITVQEEYLEKQQLGWWSLPRLKTIMRNKWVYRDKNCFRTGFRTTLATVLEHFTIMEAACQRLLNEHHEYIIDMMPNHDSWSSGSSPLFFLEPLEMPLQTEVQESSSIGDSGGVVDVGTTTIETSECSSGGGNDDVEKKG
jgi:hypothetical protein